MFNQKNYFFSDNSSIESIYQIILIFFKESLVLIQINDKYIILNIMNFINFRVQKKFLSINLICLNKNSFTAALQRL